LVIRPNNRNGHGGFVFAFLNPDAQPSEMLGLRLPMLAVGSFM
jgi:hypothetical protein